MDDRNPALGLMSLPTIILRQSTMPFSLALGNKPMRSKKALFQEPLISLIRLASIVGEATETRVTLSSVGGVSSITFSVDIFRSCCTVDLPEAFGSTYNLLLGV